MNFLTCRALVLISLAAVPIFSCEPPKRSKTPALEIPKNNQALAADSPPLYYSYPGEKSATLMSEVLAISTGTNSFKKRALLTRSSEEEFLPCHRCP